MTFIFLFYINLFKIQYKLNVCLQWFEYTFKDDHVFRVRTIFIKDIFKKKSVLPAKSESCGVTNEVLWPNQHEEN